jgi:uncharacterized hydrophobic protein (TIGR00341 family)
MPFRLIEMVLPENWVEEAKELLQGPQIVDVWYDRISERQTLLKILVSMEETEPLIDLLDKHYSNIEGFRLILLPVVASVPRLEEPVKPSPQKEETTPSKEERRKAERINREELYDVVKDTIKPSWVYVIMVILSAIVAAIGILDNNVAVVIGAMVIAPLLGPNIALALATNLGDLTLAQKSLKTNAIGIFTALILSFLLGIFLDVNPAIPEIAYRTKISLVNVVLALASGSAGALAFTSGASVALVGVMVAVAILPPVVTLGLLLGSGYIYLALNALWLLLTNLICINLSGVTTFWIQGIKPTTWWEVNIARRATLVSVLSCAMLLAILIVLILFSDKINYKILYGK